MKLINRNTQIPPVVTLVHEIEVGMHPRNPAPPVTTMRLTRLLRFYPVTHTSNHTIEDMKDISAIVELISIALSSAQKGWGVAPNQTRV